jgi:hypothetical protein
MERLWTARNPTQQGCRADQEGQDHAKGRQCCRFLYPSNPEGSVTVSITSETDAETVKAKEIAAQWSDNDG